MGFLAVFLKTLADLTRWQRVLVFLVLGLAVAVPLAYGWTVAGDVGSMRGERILLGDLLPGMQVGYVMGEFAGLVFVWVSGVFLAFVVGSGGVGLISKELNEGTLLLLLSKPLARHKVVLGKLAGLVASAVLIEALLLLVLIAVMWVMLPLHVQTVQALLVAVPWVLLYSLLVAILFGTVALLISTHIHSQVGGMSLMVVFIIFVSLGFGLIGLISGGVLGADDGVRLYKDWHIHLLDGAYHLGNTYVPFLTQATGGEMLPAERLQLFGMASRALEDGVGSGHVLFSWGRLPGAPGAELAGFVHPAVSILYLLGLSGLALVLAMRGLSRKNVS